jgi:hypothetical protein
MRTERPGPHRERDAEIADERTDDIAVPPPSEPRYFAPRRRRIAAA